LWCATAPDIGNLLVKMQPNFITVRRVFDFHEFVAFDIVEVILNLITLTDKVVSDGETFGKRISVYLNQYIFSINKRNALD